MLVYRIRSHFKWVVQKVGSAAEARLFSEHEYLLMIMYSWYTQSRFWRNNLKIQAQVRGRLAKLAGGGTHVHPKSHLFEKEVNQFRIISQKGKCVHS